MVNDSENVGIAFALVIGAGASTGLGASVVFFPSLVKLASKKTLAGGLGLSAGVMTYVSFIEIFDKSLVAFTNAGREENEGYVYATLCFFGGVVAMVLLNLLVHGLLGFHDGDYHDDHHNHGSTQDTSGTDNEEQQNHAGDRLLPPCCSTDPCIQIDSIQQMADIMQARARVEAREEADGHTEVIEEKNEERRELQQEEKDDVVPDNQLQLNAAAAEDGALAISKKESQKLSSMSLNTALAIALHNFPEGLATFVSALNDPKVGVVLAIAIAIHNIPEGLCVAMPVYYATGSRWRAFGWAFLSGVSEPIAAVLGWLVLANSISETLYAVLFGMVSGMMVIISIRELLPTAHRYDPDDSIVTMMFMFGMAVMALSLVLFKL